MSCANLVRLVNFTILGKLMSQQFHMHKSRLDALVDGVFAVALTILVLEVKVPSIDDKQSASALWHAIAHDGIVIGAYFFSFAMLGQFWVWHHRLTEKIKMIDLPLLICSLSFLSLVCFFPFAAALFGRYITNITAHLIYLPLLGLILASQALFFWLAIRRDLILESVSQEQVNAAHRNNLLGCGAFLLAFSPTAYRLTIWLAVTCGILGLYLLWHVIRLKRLQKTQTDIQTQEQIQAPIQAPIQAQPTATVEAIALTEDAAK